MNRRLQVLTIIMSAAGLAGPAVAQGQPWSTFNGDLAANKYATADQITPANVGKLQKAWEVHTGDVSDGKGDKPESDWSATPLFVNNTVYLSTPFYRIFAIEPDTGKVKWIYDSKSTLKALTQPDLKTRGVAYWQAANPAAGQPCQKIVYLGTMDAKLHAVDADTGKLCSGFGDKGILNVDQWNTVNAKWPLSLLQPPTVYKDTLFIGWAGKDWHNTAAPPGQVFAVDAQTGKLKWTFSPIPEAQVPNTGTADVWASMSVDEKNGILYLPVSSPSPNYFGGKRKDKLPLVSSITALDANTGKVLWSRQLVHHDIWDYDPNAAPVLVDLHKDGKTIPALVASTKMGFFFVLNRLTGEPIYPIEERPAPKSDIPEEAASPTQPYVATPQPAVPDKWPGVFWLADVTSAGYCSRRAAELRYDGRFTPPSLKGTLTYPATAGGTEWGGGAVDPRTQTYVVNSSSVVQLYRLIKRADYDKESNNGKKSGYYPMDGAPYGFHISNFVNWLGMPCWNPPYGTIASYDLNSGKLLWREPFGEVQKDGFYMPHSWGSVTIGAPVITKSGVIFIGGSMDSRVRALDLKTGKVLWRHLVDAPAVAMPAIYTYKGKEYVVFAAGGNAILTPRVGDQIVAFALPGGS
jgi:quinoprotein glucose dehydrogenase